MAARLEKQRARPTVRHWESTLLDHSMEEHWASLSARPSSARLSGLRPAGLENWWVHPSVPRSVSLMARRSALLSESRKAPMLGQTTVYWTAVSSDWLTAAQMDTLTDLPKGSRSATRSKERPMAARSASLSSGWLMAVQMETLTD